MVESSFSPCACTWKRWWSQVIWVAAARKQGPCSRKQRRLRKLKLRPGRQLHELHCSDKHQYNMKVPVLAFLTALRVTPTPLEVELATETCIALANLFGQSRRKRPLAAFSEEAMLGLRLCLVQAAVHDGRAITLGSRENVPVAASPPSRLRKSDMHACQIAGRSPGLPAQRERLDAAGQNIAIFRCCERPQALPLLLWATACCHACSATAADAR
jgi:hypothetical protein